MALIFVDHRCAFEFTGPGRLTLNFGVLLHCCLLSKSRIWNFIVYVLQNTQCTKLVFHKTGPIFSIFFLGLYCVCSAYYTEPVFYKTGPFFLQYFLDFLFTTQQGGRSWQLFVEGKNVHENFCQARIYYFRDKCVVFARNPKFANSAQYNMQYVQCNSALLAQETLSLTQKGTFFARRFPKSA